jgi:hypothetical protein
MDERIPELVGEKPPCRLLGFGRSVLGPSRSSRLRRFGRRQSGREIDTQFVLRPLRRVEQRKVARRCFECIGSLIESVVGASGCIGSLIESAVAIAHDDLTRRFRSIPTAAPAKAHARGGL